MYSNAVIHRHFPKDGYTVAIHPTNGSRYLLDLVMHPAGTKGFIVFCNDGSKPKFVLDRPKKET